MKEIDQKRKEKIIIIIQGNMLLLQYSHQRQSTVEYLQVVRKVDDFIKRIASSNPTHKPRDL